MTVLRPATALDAGRVGAILSAWIDETPWMPRIHTRAEDIAHAAMMVDRGWVTVSETSGITGFLARNGDDIHALYIAPEQRGQGIGSRLLADAMQQQDQLTLWTFQSNTGAQTFYERHGFSPVERTDGTGNDEGLPDIRYQWQRTGQ
ncbi:GNAT family N-acetyltransferase [Marivita sp.]|uniref:GNAT family N-acetyltransferase n=1 Tax=Marivita sp. TaxID=2003365 RepID=UPI0025C2FE73|nr:GNAT family N-acetyltransferase [Marivita sp.]